MQARFIGGSTGTDEWELVGTRGCCTFVAHIIDGRTHVVVGTACHACLNELNTVALERNWQVVRPPLAK